MEVRIALRVLRIGIFSGRFAALFAIALVGVYRLDMYECYRCS
jgi:hypothetical protein